MRRGAARRRIAAASPDGPASRAARWVSRQDKRAVPTLAEVAALPGWTAWDADRRMRCGVVAGLIAARPALDRELDGTRLEALAALVGESMFDAVCDLPARTDNAAAALPSPGALLSAAATRLRATLPLPFGAGVDDSDVAAAVELVGQEA